MQIIHEKFENAIDENLQTKNSPTIYFIDRYTMLPKSKMETKSSILKIHFPPVLVRTVPAEQTDKSHDCKPKI